MPGIPEAPTVVALVFVFVFSPSSASFFLSRQSGKPGQSTKLVRSAHLYPVVCVTPEGDAVT